MVIEGRTTPATEVLLLDNSAALAPAGVQNPWR